MLTILLALFLALSKRRHELVLLADGATGHRRILEEYSPYLLDQMISVVTASTLVAYAIYTVSPETMQKFHTDRLGADAAVPAVWHLPVPLSGAPEGRGRQPVRHAARRPAAARVRGLWAAGGHHLRAVIAAGDRSLAFSQRRNKYTNGEIESRNPRTSPATVLRDYHSLMNLAGYQDVLAKDADTALKVNISWHFFFPGSSTTPWQLDGVIKAMKQDGFDQSLIHACHNRTVVIDAHLGERENKQINVVQAHGLRNIHIYETEEWINIREAVGDLTKKFLCLNEVYPRGS